MSSLALTTVLLSLTSTTLRYRNLIVENNGPQPGTAWEGILTTMIPGVEAYEVY